MHIDWAALAVIAVVAAAATLTVVLLVAFALVGLSPASQRRDEGPGGAPGGQTAVGTALGVLCLLAAGLVVCWGLYLIVA